MSKIIKHFSILYQIGDCEKFLLLKAAKNWLIIEIIV